MHRYAALLILSASLMAAQSPATLTPKPSPAADTLTKTAKEQTEDQKHVNDLFQQARHSLDNNQKAINDELTKTQAALEDRLKADKHYSSDLAHIADLKKQLNDIGAKAQSEFMKTVGPAQQKLQNENSTVQALIPIVRMENSWPDTVTFATDTQKWTDAAKAAPPAK